MAQLNDTQANALSHSSMTPAKFTTAALSSSTAAVGDLTGAIICVMTNTGANPGTYTTRKAAQMISDGGLQVDMIYLVYLCNAQGTGTLTLAGGTGVTITGTATMAANIGRIYTVTVNSPTAITFQNCGSFTTP